MSETIKRSLLPPHFPAWTARASLTGKHTELTEQVSPRATPERAGPKEPQLGGPPSWLPVPPLTWRGGLPLLLSEPAAWEGLRPLIPRGKL